jgi:hypothetical protein
MRGWTEKIRITQITRTGRKAADYAKEGVLYCVHDEE